MILINDKERELLGPVLMGEVAVLESIEATEQEKSAALGILMKAEFLISCIIQETLYEKQELPSEPGGAETGEPPTESPPPANDSGESEGEPTPPPKNRWIK